MPIGLGYYTDAVTNIAYTSFTGSGRVIAESSGPSTITQVGICWKPGTSGDPTIADSETHTNGSWSITEGGSPDRVEYSGSCTGLSKGTSYRVAFFCYNFSASSYVYGNTVGVTTLGAGDNANFFGFFS